MGDGTEIPTTTTTTVGANVTDPNSPSVKNTPGGGSSGREEYDSVGDAEDAVVDEDKYKIEPVVRTPTAAGYSWFDFAEPTLPGSRPSGSFDRAQDEIYDPNAPIRDEGWGFETTEQAHGQLKPLYSDKFPLYTLNQMTTAELTALEMRLYEGGYVSEPEGITRRWDLVSGFTNLVIEADFGRNSWEDQLDFAIENAVADEEEATKTWAQLNPFVAPVERIPDYATLSQSVKATVRNHLERDATSSEMSLLSDYLKSQHHNAYQSNELQVAKQGWEARARAQETEQSQTAGSVQLVDPDARFQEEFDDRYEGELDHRQRVDQTASNSQGLFASLDTISRMI